MSWDFVYTWSQVLAVLFAGVALVSGFIVNKRSSMKIAGLDNSTAHLQKSNLEAQSELEKEKKKRLEMEKSLAPRSIEQGRAAQALKEFAGLDVMLSSINDDEAQNTAGRIRFLLQMAEWNLVADKPPAEDRPFPPSDGITITYPFQADKLDRSQDAAEELKDQLAKSDVESNVSSAMGLPPNTIRIVVGARPMTYFKERWRTPEEMARDEERKKQDEKFRKESRERRKQDREDALKHEALIEKLRRELGEEEMKRRGLIAPDSKPEGEHK